MTPTIQCLVISFVLWQQNDYTFPDNTLRTDWLPMATYDTLAECNPARKQMGKSMSDLNDRMGEVLTRSYRLGAKGVDQHFVCLPDSVDPRGPKGK